MSWTICLARPELNKDTDWKVALAGFYEEVGAWLKANRTGSTSCKAMSRGRPYDAGGSSGGAWPRTPYFLIKFRKKRDAVLFKMFFAEYIFVEDTSPAYDRIILPLIRRVMPSIIAHDICGVQSMTGPVKSIFSLPVKYIDNSLPIRAKGRSIRDWRRALTKTSRCVRRKKQTRTNPPQSQVGRKSRIMEQVLENTRRELERVR